MPFSLTEVMYDMDLAQPVTVLRSQGVFGPGSWKESQPLIINTIGIITVAGAKALQMIPEGDRVSGSLQLLTEMRLCVTHQDAIPPPDGTPAGGLSDKIQWNGTIYMITSVEPWKDFGFWSSILERLKGN